MNIKIFDDIIKKAIKATILTDSSIYDKVENFIVHNYCSPGWDRKTLIENWNKNLFTWCKRNEIIHLFKPNKSYFDYLRNVCLYDEREYIYEVFMNDLINYFKLYVSSDLQGFKKILKKFIEYKNKFIQNNFSFSIRGDEIRIGGESVKYSVKEFKKWFDNYLLVMEKLND